MKILLVLLALLLVIIGLALLLMCLDNDSVIGKIIACFLALTLFVMAFDTYKYQKNSIFNFDNVEYSESGKKPYDTHITKGNYTSTSDYLIKIHDHYYDESYELSASKDGNKFKVYDDDVSDNFRSYISKVEFVLSDHGKKIQEYDYETGSNKPTKLEKQTIIKDAN